MERIIVVSAGILAALGGLIFFIKLLILRIGGVRTNAEVIAVKEPKQGYFVHTLRFDHNGNIVEQDDKTGYSQPFSKGDMMEITCSRTSPEKFEYTTALNKNLIISGVLIAMSILIVIRFAFFVI